MKKYLKVFDFIGAPLLACLAIGLLMAETRKELRIRKDDKGRRLRVNAGVATVGLAGLRLALVPAMLAAGRWTGKNRIGLSQWLPLPRPLKGLLAFLLLDYTNYLWHTLNHRIPWLWRFHTVHHTDLDMDVSTAWRFHVGEVLLSVFFRGSMVAVAGARAPIVLLYEVLYEGATAFHHSNWQLPVDLERKLNKLIVTPRMHGIHHSIVRNETDSNYAVIFTFWDRLHQTIRLNVPQAEVDIGVPSYRNPAEQTPGFLLALPFRKQRDWALPDGTKPERHLLSGDKTHLAE
ncbi:sterol desaturase family protein [Rhodocytophaga aerolata]|uniref:Sterol desaturase family protein n=1 Tax=Rhodocytophaga aerolata TaxID=455078 RepID=A0ABT8R4X8_9BACT|nr:sterol desaturase family protein [Rhodocytophaga aerolata]MDO1446348.1 sterol desaturase family protein [Rhodocytophaga aerolata]